MTFNVSGWQPDWLSARDQLQAQAAALKELRGQRITHTWIVWDNQHDKWFADLPVVVCFEHGRQLEVCWQKFDDLSITWNTIDVDVTPTAWVTWPLTWRPNGHAALDLVVGDTLTDVAGTEHLFTTRQISPAPTTGKATHSTWLCGGIWLQGRESGLHIFNALDENGLSNDEPDQESSQRRIEL